MISSPPRMSNAKYIILLGDGMADFPVESLGNRSPLAAACTQLQPDERLFSGLSESGEAAKALRHLDHFGGVGGAERRHRHSGIGRADAAHGGGEQGRCENRLHEWSPSDGAAMRRRER